VGKFWGIDIAISFHSGWKLPAMIFGKAAKSKGFAATDGNTLKYGGARGRGRESSTEAAFESYGEIIAKSC
jgi:hypothetical protein